MNNTIDHTTSGRRLIEESYPQKKVSADSKHEKNMRHGHISTLHIWPARRPLAASRAALLAALLPDPGSEQARAVLNKRIGMLTRWTTENGPELAKFRAEIRAAYGGRAPRVLDMFAGGGAIPFEAMRLGCDVTAVDFNPVAWFLLRCTLEYPQRFVGKSWPIPRHLERYLDANSDNGNSNTKGKKQSTKGPVLFHKGSISAPWMEDQARLGTLADHIRVWGGWVLAHVRREMRDYYPKVDNQIPLTYIWARTVPCPDPSCRTEVPLLKTLWLSKANGHRTALRMILGTGTDPVSFEIWYPKADEKPGTPTMAASQTPKAICPRCGTQLPNDYLRQQINLRKTSAQMIAVVTGSEDGKNYRTPHSKDLEAAQAATRRLAFVERIVPHGRPTEPISPAYLSSQHQAAVIVKYGLDHYNMIFTDRTMLALLTFIRWSHLARRAMARSGYPEDAISAISSYLALVIDRLADYGSSITHWNVVGQKIGNTFSGFRLGMAWDYTEVNPTVKTSGGYIGQLDWVAKFVAHATAAITANSEPPKVRHISAVDLADHEAFDAIITDPPYYDAVPYADLSDFFYVWLKRSLDGQGGEAFTTEVVPKQGELISNAGLFDKDELTAKQHYEDGMAQAFAKAYQALKPNGICVIVFAHKDVRAWETLVSAMIRAGWTVTASWPIDTEMGNRTRALNSAALASSIWLVCRKRSENAGIGRYGDVMRRMQARITERLRSFWDLKISGPDFVWAAIGPALESYSSYRDVRRLDGSTFTVGEFLREVRRLVTDFALGQILHGVSTGELDETTRYYLMHRHSFGMGPAPVGECLLLAGGYGLNLDDLRGERGVLTKANAPKKAVTEDEEATGDDGESAKPKASGNDLRLLSYDERARADLGEPLPNGSLPMIDMLHRLMRLWAAGQLDAVTEYVARHGLGQEHETFWAMAQGVLEMSDPKTRERTLLESLVSWGRKRGTTVAAAVAQPVLLDTPRTGN